MAEVVRMWRMQALAGVLGSCLAAALGLCLAAAAGAQDKPPEIPKALVKEAGRALKGKKSEIPGSLGVVHELVKRQHAAGQHKKSLSTLKKAIRVAPWDMLCRIYEAEALAATRKKKAARKKALWILDHAREDRARVGAAKLADELLSRPTSKYKRGEGGGKPRIVLVPMPPVDVCVVQAVAERLTEKLTIPVVVRTCDWGLPPEPSRVEGEEAVQKHRARFEETATDDHVRALLAEHKIEMDQLLENHIFVAVYRPWLIRMGLWKELRLFDRDVTAKRRVQWEANKLDTHIRRAAGAARGPNDYLFTITAGDIHLGDKMGFNFAASGGRSSTIAYSRFLSWATGEDPDWDKLVTRVHKQVMCSVGRCSGVRRCPDFGCCCSYANGLRDHDAKKEEFCEDCRTRIAIARRP